MDLLGGSFLGDALLGGDPAEAPGGPQGRAHGHATVAGDLSVSNPGGLQSACHGQATAAGSLGITKKLAGTSVAHATVIGDLTVAAVPTGFVGLSHGLARVGATLGERRLLIPVYVGIRTFGRTLSAAGGVAKAGTEPHAPDTPFDQSGGLLVKRALHTYFT